jgi:hypothetical protein
VYFDLGFLLNYYVRPLICTIFLSNVVTIAASSRFDLLVDGTAEKMHLSFCSCAGGPRTKLLTTYMIY